MNDFRVSFYCFLALVRLVPWGLGFVLWRRIGSSEKAVRIIASTMALLAFVIGAAWWNVIHPAIWPNPPAAQANPNPPPGWGLVILGGVAGVICLALGTVVLVALGALLERARPGTFALFYERLRPAKTEDSHTLRE